MTVPLVVVAVPTMEPPSIVKFHTPSSAPVNEPQKRERRVFRRDECAETVPDTVPLISLEPS